MISVLLLLLWICLSWVKCYCLLLLSSGAITRERLLRLRCCNNLVGGSGVEALVKVLALLVRLHALLSLYHLKLLLEGLDHGI